MTHEASVEDYNQFGEPIKIAITDNVIDLI